MASRTYRRDSSGRFAGSGGRVTTGKAGGFANASHRANVAGKRAAKSRNRAIAKGLVRSATGAAMVGGTYMTLAGDSSKTRAAGRVLLYGGAIARATSGASRKKYSKPRVVVKASGPKSKI